MSKTTENAPDEKEIAFLKLQEVINQHVPEGFAFGELYKMPSWFVPLEVYPAGYHCQKNQPLPFLSVANTKTHLALYHMGIYADAELYKWFTEAFEKETGKKPDMGKSCIRFKKAADIPFALIGRLMEQMSPAKWIATYEAAFRKK